MTSDSLVRGCDKNVHSAGGNFCIREQAGLDAF